MGKKAMTIWVNEDIFEISQLIGIINHNGKGDFFEKAFWDRLEKAVNKDPMLMKIFLRYLGEDIVKKLQKRID